MKPARRGRILAAAAVLAVAALVGVGLLRARRGAQGPAPVVPRYAMADGLARRFAVRSEAEVRIDTAAIPADPRRPGGGTAATARVAGVATAFSGELRVRLYADPAGGWNAGAFLDGAQVTIGGVTPPWAWASGNPFSFHLDRRGRVDGVAFTPLLPAETQAFLRRLASQLQVVLPEVLEPAWSVREAGPDGDAEVAYGKLAWDPAAERLQASRRVVRRVAAEGRAPDVPFLESLTVEVAASSGEVRTSLGRWLEVVRTEEESAYASEGRRWAVTRGSFTLESVDRDPGPFPDSFRAFQERMRSQAFVAAALAHTDPDLDRLAEGLDTEGALARYLALRATDRARAERFLVNYLRRNDRASVDLLRILDRDRAMQRLDEKTQLVLWRLVVEAGTPAAQRAVLEAAASPTFHHGSHVRALMYVGDFQNPQPFLVDGLMALHRDPSAVSQGDALGAVENMSLLAVGTLGYRERLDEETRAAAARALVENLGRPAPPSETAVTLKAIGNAGNDALLDAVKPWMESPDAQVRAAACEALRRMESPVAQEQLVAAFGRDSSEGVRQAALRSLGEMTLTPATAAWAREAVLGARSPADATGLVALLGGSLRAFPANEEALRALLAQNPPEAVKEAIYRFIAPR